MSELRVFSCTQCGQGYEASPPDDIHMVAKMRECPKYDSIRIPHSCENCGNLNVIYWDKQHEKFEDDFNRVNVAS